MFSAQWERVTEESGAILMVAAVRGRRFSQLDVRAAALRTVVDSICPSGFARRAGQLVVEPARVGRARARVHQDQYDRRWRSRDDGRNSGGLSELRHVPCRLRYHQIAKYRLRESHRADGRAIARATVLRGQWMDASRPALWRVGYGRLDSPPSGSRARRLVHDAVRSRGFAAFGCPDFRRGDDPSPGLSGTITES